RSCPSALNYYIRNCCFLAQISRGTRDKLHGRSKGGGRVSRSVWSAWSLLPLSDVWRGSKAGASSTHSIRFARFGFGSAALRTDAPCLLRWLCHRYEEMSYISYYWNKNVLSSASAAKMNAAVSKS